MVDFPERSMATTFSALSSSSDLSTRPRSLRDAAGGLGLPALVVRGMAVTLSLLRFGSSTGAAGSLWPRSGLVGRARTATRAEPPSPAFALHIPSAYAGRSAAPPWRPMQENNR